MKILIVSDTHGNLPIRLENFDVDSIIHAGDIGDSSFFSKFNKSAKSKNLFAVSGNADFALESRLPKTICSKIDDLTFFLVHNLSSPNRIIFNNCRQIQDSKPNLVIFGHTHIPLLEERDGVIFINPGSLGKEGLTGRRSYAILNIEEPERKKISLEIFDVDTNKIIISKKYNKNNDSFMEM